MCSFLFFLVLGGILLLATVTLNPAEKGYTSTLFILGWFVIGGGSSIVCFLIAWSMYGGAYG